MPQVLLTVLVPQVLSAALLLWHRPTSFIPSSMGCSVVGQRLLRAQTTFSRLSSYTEDWLVSTMRCTCTLLLIGQRNRQSGAFRRTLLARVRHETCTPQNLSCWPRESAKFFPLHHIGHSSHPPPNVPHRPPADQRTECSCYFVFTLNSLH